MPLRFDLSAAPLADDPCRFRFKREQEQDNYTFDVTLVRGRAKPTAPSVSGSASISRAGSNSMPYGYGHQPPIGGSSGPMSNTQAGSWGGSHGGSDRWSAGGGGGGDGGAAVAAALREEVAKLKGALEVVQQERDDLSGKMHRSQAEVERMQAETKLIVQRSQDAMAEVERHRDELAAKRRAEADAAVEMSKLRAERDEMHAVLIRERDSLAKARSDIEMEMEKRVAAARREGEEEGEKLLRARIQEVESRMRESAAEGERRSREEAARMHEEILGLERQLKVERDRASQACETADRHHELEVAAEQRLKEQEERLKEQEERHEEKVRDLQRELASLEAQKIQQDAIAQSKVSRLCVIALPHAVAKLHDFLYQKSGSPPSGASGAYEHPSTWAQVLSLCKTFRMSFFSLRTCPMPEPILVALE